MQPWHAISFDEKRLDKIRYLSPEYYVHLLTYSDFLYQNKINTSKLHGIFEKHMKHLQLFDK
jgi:hypothetical protein